MTAGTGDQPGSIPRRHRFDHHVHTSRHSPDSVIDPLELLERARDRGLSGVVITEHDYQWQRDELDELASHAPDLVVLSGVEVSAQEGHFLVYGLPDLTEVRRGIALAQLLWVAERHNAAVVAAHPYRWGQDFDAILRAEGDRLDGLELASNNVTPDLRPRIQRALEHSGLMATGSSDGHEPEIVGCYHTVLSEPVRSIAEFAAALKSGRCRPGFSSDGPLASGPVEWPPSGRRIAHGEQGGPPPPAGARHQTGPGSILKKREA